MKAESSLQPISFTPIGIVRSSRFNALDDHWNLEMGHIELDASQFTADALIGLEEFSHVEVIFFMHQVPPSEIVLGARHPRSRMDWPKVGIFSQRGKMRPNRLGLTCCRLVKIQGLMLEVEGLDAIDGTPVLDIKPYFQEFGPKGSLRQPGWTRELMRAYWE